MYKLKYVLLFLVILLVQCKKQTAEISIIGKWVMISETWEEYEGNTLTKSGSEPINIVGVTLNFRTDGKFTATDVEGQVETYDYSYTNGKLEIDNQIGVVKIVELTNSKLVWSYESDVSGLHKEIVTDTFSKLN